MKKLKLDLDRIQVESFKVEAAESGKGTVQAHSAAPFHCGSNPLDSCDSCFPRYCPRMPASYDLEC